MSVRATVSVIALVTLGLISYLGLNTSQPNSLSIPVPKKLTSSPSLKATLASRLAGGGQDSESRKQASLILEIKKDIERSKMLAADLALQDTPEKHQAAIQGMLKHRKPHFETLFDQWDLPLDKRSSVYEIIRLRLDESRSDRINRSTSFAMGSQNAKVAKMTSTFERRAI